MRAFKRFESSHYATDHYDISWMYSRVISILAPWHFLKDTKSESEAENIRYGGKISKSDTLSWDRNKITFFAFTEQSKNPLKHIIMNGKFSFYFYRSFIAFQIPDILFLSRVNKLLCWKQFCLRFLLFVATHGRECDSDGVKKTRVYFRYVLIRIYIGRHHICESKLSQEEDCAYK